MGNIALPATGALEMIKLTGKVKSVPYVIILESTTLWFYLQRGEALDVACVNRDYTDAETINIICRWCLI